MRYETFVISARDSSHKYTLQGVKLLSSAPTEKAAEAGIRVGPGDLGSEHWRVSHVGHWSLHCYGGRVGGFRNSAVPLRRRNAIAPLDWASIIGSKARESRIRTRGSGPRTRAERRAFFDCESLT